MAPAASLVVRVSAQIAEFQKSFEDAAKTTEKFQSNFEGIATRAAAVGAFIGNIAADIAQSLVRGFGQAFRDAIRLSSEFSNSFIGLSSVARAFGTDADSASAAARRLSSDGLLPLKDSATGLKNLLAAGFNLDQAVKLMDAFKDSAAFGRQSALSFGDAVRSATEGVKNGNSILVDNAGVTKNLSQILKEAGFSAQDLSRASSDAAVRMALFNGILKETVAQTGDAERLTQTYTGQVAKLSATYDNLLANLGAAITQNATVARAIGIVGDAFLRLSQHLSNNRNAFNFVSEAVIFLVKALASTVSAINVVQQAFHGFVQGVNVVVGSLAGAFQILFKVTEKAEEFQKFTDPLRFQQHAKAADEARQAYAFLDGVMTTLQQSTRDAEVNSSRWNATLSGLESTLTNVSAELETTRGKTVELGVAATASGTALGNNFAAGSKKAADELTKLQKLLAETTPGLQEGIRSMPGVNVGRPDIDAVLIPDIIFDTHTKLQAGISKMPGLEFPIAPPKIEPALFGEEFGRQLGAVLGNAFRGGSVLNAIEDGASLIGSTLGKKLADILTTGKNALTGWIGGMVSTALPLIGSLLGPLVGKIGDLIEGAFDFNEGRDLVQDFAKSFGGFDALHAQLLELGNAGEQLWIKLTQGVGRDNPAQAKAAIEAVNEALAAQAKRQEEAGQAAAAAAREATEAQKAVLAGVQRSIDDLSREYDQLWNSIKDEAPEEVMGIIETQTRARMASVAAERAVQESELAALTAAMRDSLAEVADAAREAADAITRAFSNVKVPPIQVGVEYVGTGGPSVPAFASGGIVRRPTLALVGEAGPEAVIPLSQLGSVAPNGGTMTIVMERDGQKEAEYLVPFIPGAVRRFVPA